MNTHRDSTYGSMLVFLVRSRHSLSALYDLFTVVSFCGFPWDTCKGPYGGLLVFLCHPFRVFVGFLGALAIHGLWLTSSFPWTLLSGPVVS